MNVGRRGFHQIVGICSLIKHMFSILKSDKNWRCYGRKTDSRLLNFFWKFEIFTRKHPHYTIRRCLKTVSSLLRAVNCSFHYVLNHSMLFFQGGPWVSKFSLNFGSIFQITVICTIVDLNYFSSHRILLVFVSIKDCPYLWHHFFIIFYA